MHELFTDHRSLFVMLILWRDMNAEGQVAVDYEEIKRLTRMGKRTAFDRVDRLTSLGYIEQAMGNVFNVRKPNPFECNFLIAPVLDLAPPLNPPIYSPTNSNLNLDKRGCGGEPTPNAHGAVKKRSTTWEKEDPLNVVFLNLMKIDAYRLVFDRAKEEAQIGEMMARYGMTIGEMEEVTWQYSNWSSDLKGRKIQSPRGTLATFCRNFASKRVEKKPDSYQTEYKRTALDGIM